MWRLNVDNRIKHGKEAVKQLNTIQETDYFKAFASQNKPVLRGNKSSIWDVSVVSHIFERFQ